MRAIAGKGDYKGELGDLTIKIANDDKANILTITDRGIGMTSEEVDKYINQIAFSSAGEFLEKYKDQLDSIIGHFGLGFYSAFMLTSIALDPIEKKPLKQFFPGSKILSVGSYGCNMHCKVLEGHLGCGRNLHPSQSHIDSYVLFPT